MTDEEEKAYEQGAKATAVRLLLACARELGREDPLASAGILIAEREESVRALRELCKAHGSNTWPDDMYLPDVIEKHLGRHLVDDSEEDEDE